MSKQSLKTKAIKGMAWNTIDKITSQGISFIIGIILARLLSPSDYGLIGMLAIFFAIAALLVDSGFSNALVQKKNRTDADFSTIFYFNLLVSITLYLLLFFSAPFIAKFYNIPQLTNLTRILSLTIIINSLSLVQQSRLVVMIDFKSIALISVFSVLISGTTGIIMAYNGYGAWSLVAQTLTSAVVRAALLMYFNRWTPEMVFDMKSFRQLFSYSSNLLGSGLLATLINNIYYISIGKIFSAKELGFYTRAKQFSEILPNTISSVLQGVTFPILTSIQEERDRMVTAYGQLLGMVTFFVIPALTLLALLAEPFIRLFLTEKWVPVVPLMQWLCFARMITPISSLNMNILNAIGRSDLFFKVNLIKTPMTILALIITVPFGVKAVVIGHFVTSFISFFINAYYPGKLFGFGSARQVKEMRYVVFSTVIMSVSVSTVYMMLSSDVLKLFICGPMGIVVYLISAYLFKIKEIDEVIQLLRLLFIKVNRIFGFVK